MRFEYLAPGLCPESENTLQISHLERDISQICAYYYSCGLHKYLPTLDKGGREDAAVASWQWGVIVRKIAAASN